MGQKVGLEVRIRVVGSEIDAELTGVLRRANPASAAIDAITSAIASARAMRRCRSFELGTSLEKNDISA